VSTAHRARRGCARAPDGLFGGDSSLLCDDPEVIVIIGPADVTEVWETDTWLNPSVFAPAIASAARI